MALRPSCAVSCKTYITIDLICLKRLYTVLTHVANVRSTYYILHPIIIKIDNKSFNILRQNKLNRFPIKNSQSMVEIYHFDAFEIARK